MVVFLSITNDIIEANSLVIFEEMDVEYRVIEFVVA